MKKIIPILFLIACSFQAFSQNQQPEVKVEIKAACEDSTLDTPYKTYANHKTLECQLMKMIVLGNDSSIMKICKTRGFASFIVSNGKNYTIATTESEIIKNFIKYYNKFKSLIPRSISAAPTSVIEECLFIDLSRYENWDYVNKKNRKSRLTVAFTNGQITCIMITI